MTTVAGTAAIAGSNNIYLGGEPLVVLGPEHAATVASSGWSKDDFKRALWESACVPLGRLAPENIERFATVYPEGFKDRPAATLAPVARDWRDVMVVVAGGAGKHSVLHSDFRRHAIRHTTHHRLNREAPYGEEDPPRDIRPRRERPGCGAGLGG